MMQAKTIRLFRASGRFRNARLEVRVGQHVDERDQELILVADAFDLVVRVEDFGLVEAERLHDVLVGVGVDRLFKRLAQQVLPALGRGDVAIGAQHDVVGGQTVGGDEEAEVALDDQALVIGEAAGAGGALPQLDVALHVDLLRHPVVGAAAEVFVPRPGVFEGDQLVDVGPAVDDALVLGAHAAPPAVELRVAHARHARLGGHRLRLLVHLGAVVRYLRGGGRRHARACRLGGRLRRRCCGGCGLGRGDDVVIKIEHAVLLSFGHRATAMRAGARAAVYWTDSSLE
jgi:hypothetical protein